MDKIVMKKAGKVLLELLPVIVVLILMIFFRGEIAITIFAVLMILATFMIRYNKKELYLFILGSLMGVLFETVGNKLLGQSWGESSFLAIPLWLPLTWGYGFVLIRRIGNIIVDEE